MSGGDPTRELRPDFDPDHPRGLDEWRAVEEADPQQLADLQARIAKKLADLEMATPAIIALESTKPVTFIVSQALAAGEPLLYWLAGLQDYYNFRKVMEDREQVEKLIGADWLVYQDLEDLVKAVHHENADIESFDTSCFSGCYVTGDVSRSYLDELEMLRSNSARARRDAEARREEFGEEDDEVQAASGL